MKSVGIVQVTPTSARPVSLIVTDLAVLEPTAEGMILKERAPGLTVQEIINQTEATLIVPESVPVMTITEL